MFSCCGLGYESSRIIEGRGWDFGTGLGNALGYDISRRGDDAFAQRRSIKWVGVGGSKKITAVSVRDFEI